MPLNNLDETDYSLLAYLQNNGRASNVQLADHLNLSETPSWRRLKRLETDGIIKGYQAITRSNIHKKQFINEGGKKYYQLAFVKW